jgi:hypothetical protein
LLVYHHIYKNGGTAVWDRYRNNPGAWLAPGTEIINIPSEAYCFDGEDNVLEPITDCRFLQCRIVPGVLEQQHDNIQYAVTLRDPIDRLISGFNFWKKRTNNDLHIDTWLKFAKNCWRDPPLFVWQYEWFIRHSNYNRQFDAGVHYDKSAQHDHMHCAIQHVLDTYSVVMFMSEPNYEAQLADTFRDFRSVGDFVTNTTVMSDVKNYTTRADIDMALAEDYLEYEIKFYNSVKKKVDNKTS